METGGLGLSDYQATGLKSSELVYLQSCCSALSLDPLAPESSQEIATEKFALMFALGPDSSVVERGPEKAGVGGSIPSLATTPSYTTFLSRAIGLYKPTSGDESRRESVTIGYQIFY